MVVAVEENQVDGKTVVELSDGEMMQELGLKPLQVSIMRKLH